MKIKPTPLPANPKLVQRLEYALQWLISWVTVDIEGYPALSGILSGVKMNLAIFGLFGLVWLISKLL
jgi:hypothetical protein